MKMKKIDTRSWRWFEIKQIFNVVLPKGDIQEKKVENGDIPLISAGKINNGIVKYIDKKGDEKSEIICANCITVDMFGKAFYQPKPFYAFRTDE